MCIDNMEYHKKSTSYSIKKALRSLFNKSKTRNSNKNSTSLESLESLDNLRNSLTEQHYEEIEDNAANEKLMKYFYSDQESSPAKPIKNFECEEDVYVPVRFVRTENGTFFWTTNLQPVTTQQYIITQQDDSDLIQPSNCYSTHQYPQLQFQDRWAQA